MPPPPPPADSEVRIAMIEDSIRAFSFALIGLVPGLGIPFGILALVFGVRRARHEGRHWNPARRYRIAAILIAVIGLALSAVLVLLKLLYNFNELSGD